MVVRPQALHFPGGLGQALWGQKGRASRLLGPVVKSPGAFCVYQSCLKGRDMLIKMALSTIKYKLFQNV